MDDLGSFTPEQARALWQDYLSRQQLNPNASQNLPQRREIVHTERRLQGKLDGTLAAASSFASGPATATMSVWRKNSAGNMEDSGDNITVVNRLPNSEAITSGTIVQAEWLDGEWRIYVSDCT